MSRTDEWVMGFGEVQLEGDYHHVNWVESIRRLLSGDFGDAVDQTVFLNRRKPVYGFYEDWAGAGPFTLHLSFNSSASITARFSLGDYD